MRARFTPRRGLALLFVAGLGVALAGVLLSESARVPLRTPLVPRASRAAPASVALQGREAREGRSLFRVELMANDSGALLSHEELQLYLDAAPPGRELKRAALDLRGTPCTFVAAGRESLTGREATVFRRTAACEGTKALAAPAPVDLVAEVGGVGEVTLLGFEPVAGTAAPVQAPVNGRGTSLDLRGAFIDYPETLPRVVLLNEMWRLGRGPGWLLAAVALAVLLACCGCWLFPTAPHGREPSAASRAAPGAAAAAALLAASLGLLYAVLAPPLSGPDEPYHLLGFAELVHDQALAKDTVAWMGETHLWRIRQQPSERFRSIDVGRPYVVDDDQLRATEVAARSAILARLWAAAGSWIPGGRAPRALLCLRLLNVAVVALAVGAAAALVVALAAASYPQWLVFPFLFVPALPFFAMHVSETAVLCAVYVLLAASVAVVAFDGSRAEWAGFPLGLATGLMLAGGRSPWPLAVLVAVLLVGRLLLGARAPARRVRVAAVFWLGFGLGASVFFLAIDEAYRTMTQSYALQLADFAPGRLRELVVWLLVNPWALLLPVLAGAGLELGLERLRLWLAARLGPPARRAARLVSGAAAIAVLSSLALSLVVPYPRLPFEWTHPLTAPERVRVVLSSMAGLYRLAQPDYLLASTFWVGFGWLDTMPGALFQGLLTALVAAAVVALLVDLARRPDARRVAWLVMIGLGAVGSLAVYAVSTLGRPTTLVGRYLIGWYLAWLAVAAGGLAIDWSPASADHDGRGSWRAALLAVVTGGVHVYCLCFVLRRYF
jgi:hypothetical protein